MPGIMRINPRRSLHFNSILTQLKWQYRSLFQHAAVHSQLQTVHAFVVHLDDSARMKRAASGGFSVSMAVASCRAWDPDVGDWIDLGAVVCKVLYTLLVSKF